MKKVIISFLCFMLIGIVNVETQEKSKCIIKGIIGPKQKLKIYLVPAHYLYEYINVHEKDGERWFCSEPEAQQAGFIRCPNTPPRNSQFTTKIYTNPTPIPKIPKRSTSTPKRSMSVSDRPMVKQKSQSGCITKSGYLASVSEELLDKAVTLLVQEDMVALQKLMDTDVVFMLKGGVSVHIEDTKIFSGKVEIRPAGYIDSVWTAIEAIDCK